MAKIYSMKIALLVLYMITMCNSSAIPMWEYLSRHEKMSHLYSMFAKQVQQYCKSRTDVYTPHCKRDLLMYGLSKLNNMDDYYMDSMDPYQRGANDLIWDSMMQGHPMNPLKKHKSTTESPIYLASGNYVRNPIFDEPNRKPIVDPMDEELNQQYAEPQYNHLQSPTNVHLQYLQPPPVEKIHYLSGPAEFVVRPDGTPVVSEKNKQSPKDDDRDDMMIGRDKLPTMEELSSLRVQRYANSRFIGRPSFTFRRRS